MRIHFLMILLLQHIITATNATGDGDTCKSLSCGGSSPSGGGGLQIRFPFRIKDKQPIHCGYPGFELSCTNNNETEIELPFAGKFLVKDINYRSQNVEIYDQNDCISRRLIHFNLSSDHTPFKRGDEFSNNFSLFNCSWDDVTRKREFNYGTVRCMNSPSLTYEVFAVNSPYWSVASSLPDNCVLLADSIIWPETYANDEVNLGSFFMKWDEPQCGSCVIDGGECRYKNHSSSYAIECYRKSKGKKIAISVCVGILVFLLFGLIIVVKVHNKADKEEKENQLRIEQFLENNALKPTRYSHTEIKKMTNKFETKLGQGGYGSVFEGKLTNGIQVAVKVLDNSEGSNNGEEFVNEVATIGRIHHLNVVRLLGFCVEGPMRALVYEFMLNSSLDKFIFSDRKDKTSTNLDWAKLEEIAIGIARGLEYLHQGCDQRILHFDIKPQNILLDHNFTPKISDFGLAKLCTKDTYVTISMAAARGTMGYIAPEVFSRNFGTVSYKSDVYSFGMLLLEMVKMETRSSDGEYFPEWVYNRLNRGEELGIQAKTEGLEIVKKLTMVALWCIQWDPVDRPSMNRVLRMLEGDTKSLFIAPNPFASSSSVSSSSSGDRKNDMELTVILED